MLRRVFGPTREEETVGHRRVHKKLHKVYPSHVIDTRRKTYILNVARLGQMRVFT